ncbi:tetratricopeptide repeat protein, partial [bacterium]|nr:tetratricopeptide repeat protein [bacterium]
LGRLDVFTASDKLTRIADNLIIEKPGYSANNKNISSGGIGHLTFAKKKYDIIISNPPHIKKGNYAQYYTKDYFSLLSGHTADDGVAAALVPLDVPLSEVKVIIKTFNSVFRYIYFWCPSNSMSTKGILIGSRQEMNIDYNKFSGMLSEEKIKDDLRIINYDNHFDFLSGYVYDEEHIKTMMEKTPLNTFNKSLLEYSLFMPILKVKPGLENITNISKFKKSIIPHLRFPSMNERETAGIKNVIRQYDKAYKHITNGHLADIQETPGGRAGEYRKAREVNPGDVHALSLLSSIKQEERILKQQIADDSFNAEKYAEAALYYKKENRFEKTVEYLNGAVELDSAESAYYAGLGEGYINLNNKDKAVSLFRKAITLNPEDESLRLRIAHIYTKHNLNMSALRELQAAKKINPDNAEIRYHLALAYKKDGKIYDAHREFQKAVDINPNNACYYFELANAFVTLNQYDLAVEEFKEALKLDPTDYEIRYRASFTFLKTKKYAEAEYQLKQTIQLKPDFAPGYFNLGIIYELKGYLDAAIEEYRKSIKVDPLFEEGHSFLALAYKKKGMLKEAVAAYGDYAKITKDPLKRADAEREVVKLLREIRLAGEK